MTADQAETVLGPLAGPDTLPCIDDCGALRSANVKLGVATKYLDNYLAWMQMWEWLEGV